MATIEKQDEKALIEKLLTNEGYKGYRIDEDNYSRQYENGGYTPQYQDGNGHWRTYFVHTANRYAIRSGPRSYNSKAVSYKTAKGAMNYLLRRGVEV